jgi:Xaa-Pro aminopeptidase
MKNFNDNLLTPREELEKRIAKFQLNMQQEGSDGALIIQSSDMIYFCGTCQNAHLYIPAEGTPVIMIRRNIDRFKTDSKLEAPIVPIEKLSDLTHLIKQHDLPLPKRLGLELDVIPAALFLRYQKIFSGSQFFDCSPLIRRMRSVKSEYEIARVKESSKMLDNIFKTLDQILRPGLSEFELAGEIEGVSRREGHQGMVRVRGFNGEFYFGQLVSGANSALSSYQDGAINGIGVYPEYPCGPGSKIIQRNEPVLFDYAGARNGYVTDMTRTFVIGKTGSKFNRAYQVAREIQQLIIQKAKPGVPSGALYDLALNVARKYSLADYFLGSPYPVSFIGHGIGLELNELPVLAKGVDEPLEEGMVIAVEPKFAFPGEGGVGVENTFILTKEGLEKLSSFPDERIIEI